jgi:uncharacterized surface protein with fasciclin (FAS1) repeats
MNKNVIIIGAIVLVGILVFVFMRQSNSTIPDTMEIESETEVEEMPVVPEASLGTIVDIAVATPETSTLVAAVTSANLAATLAGAGPFTVFAPVNEAFAALPTGTVESLLLPENIADLQGILTYHVVSGSVLAGDLVDGMIVPTVNGGELTINVAADGSVSINGANVIVADIVADNGVIHLIDGVLLPPTE